jgi:hypothetical protein
MSENECILSFHIYRAEHFLTIHSAHFLLLNLTDELVEQNTITALQIEAIALPQYYVSESLSCFIVLEASLTTNSLTFQNKVTNIAFSKVTEKNNWKRHKTKQIITASNITYELYIPRTSGPGKSALKNLPRPTISIAS